MARGTPGVKRTRTISVRVSEAEWAAWEARRERSGRAEMGAWVRAVVTDADEELEGDDAHAHEDVDVEGAGQPPSPTDRGAECSAEPSADPSAQAPSRKPAPRQAAGDRPVVPEVNERAYAALVRASNNLNQLTRFSHQVQALAPGVEEAMAEVVAASRAVRGIVVAPSPRSTSTAGSASASASRGATSRRRPARASGLEGGGSTGGGGVG